MALIPALPACLFPTALPPSVSGFATTCPATPDTPFGALNLGDHVGDDPVRVAANRLLLQQAGALPAMPRWLQQVHGAAVVAAEHVTAATRADASFTQQPGVVCAVLTADCLPVLLWNRAGTAVAAAHAGWRGLSAGVLENAVDEFTRVGTSAADVCAWFGPAIGEAAYEVDATVRDAFIARDRALTAGFRPTRPGHWCCDLVGLARRLLQTAGVTEMSGGGWCTYSDDRLQSYRRHAECGRQATLIYIKKQVPN